MKSATMLITVAILPASVMNPQKIMKAKRHPVSQRFSLSSVQTVKHPGRPQHSSLGTRARTTCEKISENTYNPTLERRASPYMIRGVPHAFLNFCEGPSSRSSRCRRLGSAGNRLASDTAKHIVWRRSDVDVTFLLTPSLCKETIPPFLCAGRGAALRDRWRYLNALSATT